MKHVQEALRLAIEDAIEAMSDEPGGRHEIQPDIDAYNQIWIALKQAKAAPSRRPARCHHSHHPELRDWRRAHSVDGLQAAAYPRRLRPARQSVARLDDTRRPALCVEWPLV